MDMYNDFSDLQGNCRTNPEEAGRKLAGRVDHSRSETPPRPNARHFPDRWSGLQSRGLMPPAVFFPISAPGAQAQATGPLRRCKPRREHLENTSKEDQAEPELNYVLYLSRGRPMECRSAGRGVRG